MIPRLPGWSWEVRRDGILLVSPEGEDAGAIRYSERMRPLVAVDRLIERHAPSVYSNIELLEPCERLVTSEGEQALFVKLDAQLDGRAARRALAFVLADDFYAYVGGLATRADRFSALEEVVRKLAISDGLKLGSLRRRRFWFHAPPAWSAVALGSTMNAHYFPPTPADPSRISVYPAVPFAATSTPTVDLQRTLVEDLVCEQPGPSAGFAVLSREPPSAVRVPSRLEGLRWRMAGRWGTADPIERHVVLLRDARFAYAVELVTNAPHRQNAIELFDTLVESIEPIPSSEQTPLVVNADRLCYWAE